MRLQGVKMLQYTEEQSDALTIANMLIDIVMNEVMRTIGFRTSGDIHSTHEPHYESFERLKLQTYGIDDILDNVSLKGGSIEKIVDVQNPETFNATTHLSELIIPSLPDLCCSLSTTSKQGEGDYQHNMIRESAEFYRLGQYPRQTSTSSMFTEVSSSDIADILHDKIGNLSYDTVQLSDSEVDGSLTNHSESLLDPDEILKIPGQVFSETDVEDKTNKITSDIQVDNCLTKLTRLTDDVQISDLEVDGSFQMHSESFSDPDEFLKIPDQVLSESDVTDNRSKHSPLQQSQKFCKFNNKQYLPLSKTVSSSYCTLINEDCDEEDLDDEKELLSECSNELVNVEGESEEELIPIKRFIQTNPFICITTPSSSVLSSPCFPSVLPLDTDESMNSIKVVADDEPVKELSNWEEAVEVQINVTEPVKSESKNLGAKQESDRTKHVSSPILTRENHENSKLVDLYLIEESPDVPVLKSAEENYSIKDPENEVWYVKPGSDHENEPSASSTKDTTADANVNYLSFPNKTGKEKKKGKFISRLASAFSNLVSKKKRNKK